MPPKEFLIFTFCVLFEILAISIFFSNNLPRFESRSWQETNCIIHNIEVVVLNSFSREVPHYDTYVKYEYFFNDIPHTNEIYFENLKHIPDYKNGQKSICFVNPEDPSVSVLKKGSYNDLFVGLFYLLFPITIFILHKLKILEIGK